MKVAKKTRRGTMCTRWLALLVLLLFGGGEMGCSSDDKKAAPDVPGQDLSADTPAADLAVSDGSVADTRPTDLAGEAAPGDQVAESRGDDAPETSVSDGEAPDGDEPPDLQPGDTSPLDFGFELRIPEEHEVDCGAVPEGLPDTLVQLDVDHICTFDYGQFHGHVYVQATAVDCFVTMSPIPVFEVAGAWISLDGVVTPLDGVVYDYGGNHQNDFLEFDFGDYDYRYWHSSFGWGWRACQPMDCLQVYEPGSENFVEDGCTKDRTLPVVCVQVGADGTYPELIDTFEHCPGHENYE